MGTDGPGRAAAVAGADAAADAAERRTRRWLERVVLAENLCPFAGRALRRGDVRVVAGAFDARSCLARLAAEADALAATGEPDAADAPTVLLVVAPDAHGRGAVDGLDDFLDLVALAEALLGSLGHDGALQLASFHPDYAFEGAPSDDPANATNRAPYPTLHLLRESAVSAAVARHPDPEGIPGRNMERLRALGADGVARLLGRIDDGERT